MGDGVLESVDNNFAEFAGEGREEAFFDAVNQQLFATVGQKHYAFEAFGNLQDFHERYFLEAEILQCFYQTQLETVHLQTQILVRDDQVGGAVRECRRSPDV